LVYKAAFKFDLLKPELKREIFGDDEEEEQQVNDYGDEAPSF